MSLYVMNHQPICSKTLIVSGIVQVTVVMSESLDHSFNFLVKNTYSFRNETPLLLRIMQLWSAVTLYAVNRPLTGKW